MKLLYTDLQSNSPPVVIFPLLGTGQEQLGTIRNTRIQPANILAKILFK